jgi:lysophospholipase L1-like esterase
MHHPATTPSRLIDIRRALLSLASALAVLATIAVLLELSLGWIMPELGRRRFDARFTGNCPLELNSWGLRGELPSPDRGEPLILALGDSTTWGTGVGIEDRWISQLIEEHVEGAAATSIAAARPAADLRQLRSGLEQVTEQRHVDTVVLALCGNMVSLAAIREGESARSMIDTEPPKPVAHPSLKDRARYVLSDSTLVGGVLQVAEITGYLTGINHHRIDPTSPYGPMLAHGWRQAGLDPEVAERAWTLFERDLRDLRDACAARGIPLIATWMPSRFTISEDPRDNLKFVPRDRLAIDPNERARAICDRLEIPFADSLAAMRERRVREGWTPLYIPGDYTHLDRSGHAAVADALATLVSSALGGDLSPASVSVD